MPPESSSRAGRLATAAVLGLFAAACPSPDDKKDVDAGAPASAAPKSDKECCMGKNDCKGKGGCAVPESHSCAGKNECKGQGGCNMHCPK